MVQTSNKSALRNNNIIEIYLKKMKRKSLHYTGAQPIHNSYFSQCRTQQKFTEVAILREEILYHKNYRA